VKIVLLPDGGADALVLEWTTGAFVPDRSYFGRTMETGIGKDVDHLTATAFDRLVAHLRRPILARHLATPISWERTGDGEHPYVAQLHGRTFRVRVNDFPAEPLYTLLVEDEPIADLDDWPPTWTRPSGPKGG